MAAGNVARLIGTHIMLDLLAERLHVTKAEEHAVPQLGITAVWFVWY